MPLRRPYRRPTARTGPPLCVALLALAVLPARATAQRCDPAGAVIHTDVRAFRSHIARRTAIDSALAREAAERQLAWPD